MHSSSPKAAAFLLSEESKIFPKEQRWELRKVISLYHVPCEEKLRRWEKKIPGVKILLDVPMPLCYPPRADLPALWSASELTVRWWKSGRILSRCQTTGAPGEEVWRGPGPCQGRWQLLGTLRHSLCPYRWAQIVSQGNGDGAGWGLRKGKSQGSRGGNIHSGGRAVCQEENAGTKLPSMFVLEWGSDIQTEHCLFARTHVKGLFVPSWNPGGVCLS